MAATSSTPEYALGNDFRRRITDSTALLTLIDRSRSEASKAPLTGSGEATTPPVTSPLPKLENPLDAQGIALLGASDHKLKLRLIDAFALICATKRDVDNIAAVCLEESPVGVDGVDGGVTLRLARNSGVGEALENGLRELLAYLTKFANGSKSIRPRGVAGLS